MSADNTDLPNPFLTGSVFSGAGFGVGDNVMTSETLDNENPQGGGSLVEKIRVSGGEMHEVGVGDESHSFLGEIENGSKIDGIGEEDVKGMCVDDVLLGGESNLSDLGLEGNYSDYVLKDGMNVDEMGDDLSTGADSTARVSSFLDSEGRVGDNGGLDASLGRTSENVWEDKKKNDEEVQYLPSDLVWGKVKSHPWWPGQIFEPWDASETARKHFKQNSYLVAYFGDQTFAWNEEVKLKPFWPNFSQMAKQSMTGGFMMALDSAFEEAHRRVEYAMSCRCIGDDVYNKISTQIIKNAGIREESSVRKGGDRFFTAFSFEPVKFVPYIKALALLPDVELDKLEVVMAGALLSSFYRWKGYFNMAKFSEPYQLFVDEAGDPSLIEKVDTDLKVEEGLDAEGKKQIKRKARKLSSSSAARKQEPVESSYNDLEVKEGRRRRKRTAVLDAEDTKQSTKVGEKIVRIASQLSRATELDRVHALSSGKAQQKGTRPPVEHSSPVEMLLQLQLAAVDPMGELTFLGSVVSFFSDFRNSVALEGLSHEDLIVEKSNRKSRKRLISSDVIEGADGSDGSAGLRTSKRKKKLPSKYAGESADCFEDSYWTDRIITLPVGEALPDDEVGTMTPTDAPAPDGGSAVLPAGKSDTGDKIEGETEGITPTAMILNFSDSDSIPSEEELNEIFCHYGSLLESETKVVRGSQRARVVFRRKSDAENAFSSPGKFRTFGPSLSSYHLNYDPALQKASSQETAEV